MHKLYTPRPSGPANLVIRILRKNPVKRPRIFNNKYNPLAKIGYETEKINHIKDVIYKFRSKFNPASLTL
jgi:hypothetical protein